MVLVYFAVAAVAIYWWARGSVILAIAATLPVLMLATQEMPLVLVALPLLWAPVLVVPRLRSCLTGPAMVPDAETAARLNLLMPPRLDEAPRFAVR